MYKCKKIKTYILSLAILIAFSTMLFTNIGTANSADIDVRMDHKGKYTRLAFSFPRLTAYYIEKYDNSLSIKLDIKEQLKLPNKATPIIKGLSQSLKDGELEIKVSTAGNFTVKDYRLQRRVVFDIYSTAAKQEKKEEPVKKQETTKVPKKTDKKTTDKKDTVAKAPKQKKTPNNLAAKNLKEVREKLAKYINVAKKDDTKEDALPDLPKSNAKKASSKREENIYKETPTKIAITKLTPFKIAVFKRTGLLWIVTDSSGKASTPLVEGPLKPFIKAPRIFKFKGGTAYAYKLPRKLYPIIKKHGLMWEIALYNNDYSEKEPTAVNNMFDDNSKQAKVSINLKSAGDPILFEDPIVGDKLFVVPVGKAGNSVINENSNIDFKIRPAELGLVIKPYNDAIRAYSVNDNVFIISREGSLNLQNVTFSIIGANDTDEKDNINYINANRIFDFPEWSRGELKHMLENKIELQNSILDAKSPQEVTVVALDLAKLYFSNGFGFEASGMLDIAEENSPEIAKNSDFIAIRGATEAMSGRYERAIDYFSYPSIQQNPEIKLWHGLAAAKTEQWKKAERSFPNNNILLLQYPKAISISFTLYMAESSLRLGKTNSAEQLLDTIKHDDPDLRAHHKAAIEYLKGEVANQKGDFKQAIEHWEPVAEGVDRLYHTKAALALTKLKIKKNMITLDEAINEIESLRFAWRGDRLEIEVLNTLGDLKEKNLKPLEALEDYQKAIKVSKMIGHDFAYILEDMRKIFHSLFMEDAYKGVTPLEAISVYNKFNHLYPESETAARLAVEFSDYLVLADLLPKATKLLEGHLENKIVPYDLIPSTGNKLAAIYLMESKPRKALKALLATRLDIDELPPMINEERILLKAQAYSELGKTDMAIELLDTIPSKKTTLMKADVLWESKRWMEAADILLTLLPSDMKMLDKEKDADHIINIAIAYKFAKKDDSIRALKNKYQSFLDTTNKAAAFKIITRDPIEATLSDKATIKNIASEATVFKNFFENYKSENMR